MYFLLFRNFKFQVKNQGLRHSTPKWQFKLVATISKLHM